MLAEYLIITYTHLMSRDSSLRFDLEYVSLYCVLILNALKNN